MIEIALSLVIASLFGSISILLRDVVNNLLLGAWMRASGEIEEGDRIRIKTEFSEKEGEVIKVYLRNVLIDLDNDDEETLLIECSKVMENDVIRKRD